MSYDVMTGDRRPATLIRKFADLYSTARLDALDALDALPDLKMASSSSSAASASSVHLIGGGDSVHHPPISGVGGVDTDELKSKILFSVVVVSHIARHFQGQSIRDRMYRKVRSDGPPFHQTSGQLLCPLVDFISFKLFHQECH